MLQRYQAADFLVVQALEGSLRTFESFRVAFLQYGVALSTFQQDQDAIPRARLNAELFLIEFQKVLLDTKSTISEARGTFQECLNEALYNTRRPRQKPYLFISSSRVNVK